MIDSRSKDSCDTPNDLLCNQLRQKNRMMYYAKDKGYNWITFTPIRTIRTYSPFDQDRPTEIPNKIIKTLWLERFLNMTVQIIRFRPIDKKWEMVFSFPSKKLIQK